MSYNYESFVGKLILYQHGLGDNEKRLQDTIDRIVEIKPSKNMKYYGYINISNYDGKNNCYIDDNSERIIKSTLSSLTNICSANPDKNVHIATYLNGNQPIEYQKIVSSPS